MICSGVRYRFVTVLLPDFLGCLQVIDFMRKNGGSGRNRTGVHGVAASCTKSTNSYIFHTLSAIITARIKPQKSGFSTTPTLYKTITYGIMFPVFAAAVCAVCRDYFGLITRDQQESTR